MESKGIIGVNIGVRGGLAFRAQGLGFRVEGLGLKVKDGNEGMEKKMATTILG